MSEVEWPLPISASDLDDLGDETLLELIKHGAQPQRKQAFSAVIKRYQNDVLRLIRSKKLPEDEVRDIFSSVWETVLWKLPNFVWRGTPFKSWLMSIASRKVLEHLRGVGRCVPLDEETTAQASNYIDAALRLDEAPPHEVSPEVQTQADVLLKKLMSRLTPVQRKIINMLYYKNWSSEKIGQKLGLTAGNVRVIHKRTLEKLRSSHNRSADGEEGHDGSH